MAKVIAYQVQIDGVDRLITNQNELRQAVKDTQAEYKKSDFGSKDRQEALKQLGALKKLEADARAEVRKSGREFEIAADKGKQSYRALNAELVNLRMKFKELSRAEREGAIGQDLVKRIGVLDRELKDIDASIGNYQRNVGNYASAFADLGGIDLSAFSSVPGAITAVGTAAIAGTKALLDMTEQVRELRGQIQTLTGATGGELDSLTSRTQAIAETFGQDAQQIITAANAVAQQTGEDINQIFTRIEEGFIAGSNQTGDFLDQLREYPGFFKEAGLGADQLFNVINKAVTQGIYSDKGVDTIKEAALSLRELPQASRDALEAIGLDSKEIEKVIEEQGIGAAIGTVSTRLGELRADSPEVGQALADIFKGAGEDAGLDFILSLKDLGQETGSLIDQSNEYQLQQQRTLEVNQRFAAVQNDIAEAVGGQGAEIGNLVTQIKTGLLQVLLAALERGQQILSIFTPVGQAFFRLGQALGLVGSNGKATQAALAGINAIFKAGELVYKGVAGALTFIINQLTKLVNFGKQIADFLGVTDLFAAGLEVLAGSSEKAGEKQEDLGQATEGANDSLKKYKENIEKAAVVTDKFAKDSITALQKKVSDLKKEINEASPDNLPGLLEKLLKAEQALESAEEFRNKLREELTRDPIKLPAEFEATANNQDQLGPLKDTLKELYEDELDIVKQTNDKIVENYKARNEQILQDQIRQAEQIQEIQANIFGGLQTALGAISQVEENRAQVQIQELEERYGREIQLAEGNEEKKAQLESELDKKRQRIEKEAFERQKAVRIATALTSLAEGTVNILAAPTTIPDPFGAIFKGVRVALLTATTAAQIGSINQQRIAARGGIFEAMAGGLGTIFGSGGTIQAGIARGATHSDPGGGIALSINGLPALIENGEAVDTDERGRIAVINKRSTAAFKPMLDQIRGRTFAGKSKVLSGINNYKQYGVAFGQEGLLVPNQAGVASILPPSVANRATVATFTEAEVQQLATTIAQQVYRASRDGLEEGLDNADRIRERKARQRARTGT
jgi:hypothetical protein